MLAISPSAIAALRYSELTPGNEPIVGNHPELRVDRLGLANPFTTLAFDNL
jgi:hypothetical protein